MNNKNIKSNNYCNLNSIIYLSTVDWNGHSSITLFFNGCSFNCKYCYNLDCLTEKKKVSLNFIKNEIKKSIKFISSVVFLGGEPLEQIDSIIELAKYSKENNLLVGIHTNGFNTNGIIRLIALNIVDKFFVDIKAPFNNNKYFNIIQNKNIEKIIDNIKKSIIYIDSSSIELELKTTIIPMISGSKEDILEIANWINNNIKNKNKTTYILQQGITNTTKNKNIMKLKECNITDINQ